MSQSLPYYLDLGPGTGARPPRTTSTSDSARLSLDGDWRFRLVPAVADTTEGFEEPEFDDGAWDTLPVPAHWQLHGYGKPAYTNVQYPFPVDPPRVPDRNPTGEYRRRFTLPPGWDRGGSTLVSSSRMLAPPASRTARVWPAASHAPVCSRTSLTGGIGPCQRLKISGSGAGSVR